MVEAGDNTRTDLIDPYTQTSGYNWETSLFAKVADAPPGIAKHSFYSRYYCIFFSKVQPFSNSPP